MQHLIEAQTQDISVGDGHAFQSPVVGGLADLLIEFCALLTNAVQDAADEISNLRVAKFEGRVAIDPLKISFGVLVQQEQHLQDKATGFGATGHCGQNPRYCRQEL